MWMAGRSTFTFNLLELFKIFVQVHALKLNLFSILKTIRAGRGMRVGCMGRFQETIKSRYKNSKKI